MKAMYKFVGPMKDATGFDVTNYLTVGVVYEIDTSKTFLPHYDGYCVITDSGCPLWVNLAMFSVCSTPTNKPWLVSPGYDVVLKEHTAVAKTEKRKCDCDIRDIMTFGCKCGGV